MSSVPKKQLMSSSLDTFKRSFIIYKFQQLALVTKSPSWTEIIWKWCIPCTAW